MKAICTLLSIFFLAQGAMAQPTYFGPNYTHLSSGSNCIYNYTLLDQSIIGHFPSDIIIFNHVYGTTSGTHQAYMPNSFGLWDESTTWSLFDETSTPMDTNLAFNVLNARQNGTGMVHTVTAENSVNNWSLIDNPLLNNNPNAIFFITKTWTNGIYDSSHVGIWYSESAARWSVYNEDGFTPLQLNSTYNIFIPNAGTTWFKHVATTTDYITVLDHPLLNGNPNARIFVAHDYTNGAGTTGYINDEIGVWYNGSNWTIYAEVLPNLFVGATFNVLIVSDFNTGIEKHSDQANLKLFPNPASNHLTIDISESDISSIPAITLSTSDGRCVLNLDKPMVKGNQITLDLSRIPSGLYILSLKSRNAVLSKKVNIVR